MKSTFPGTKNSLEERVKELSSLQEEIFQDLKDLIVPGISGRELLYYTETRLQEACVELLPGSVSFSLNSVAYHGKSDFEELQSGDLLTADICFSRNGAFIDGAVTYGVGELSTRDALLLDAARGAVLRGIEVAEKIGKIGDILMAIDEYTGLRGFSLVREGVGHGIGKALHCEPVLSFLRPEYFSTPLTPGMLFTIEPVVVAEGERVLENERGEGVTLAGGKAAQFEVVLSVKKGIVEVINSGLLKIF